MLLIDASNINSGGGASLLSYLVEQLSSRKIDYHIITDIRWKNNNVPLEQQTCIKTNLFNRSKNLKQIILKVNPGIILFFGNFPAPYKIEHIKTYTLIQNTLVLGWDYTRFQKIAERLYLFLTQLYLRKIKSNSNRYIFQTPTVRDAFIQSYKIKAENTFILPFFREMNTIADYGQPREMAFIYVSGGMPHKNHINLFKAWELLAQETIFPKLYITLPKDNLSATYQYFQQLQNTGVDIQNLGILPQSEILTKCSQVTYSIFPSLTETVGLSLIESTKAGCKVLASDLPYTYDVIKPSLVFDPFDPGDIANKVKFALTNPLPHTIPVLENKIEDFIQLLTA